MNERPRIEYADPVKAMQAALSRSARPGAGWLPESVLRDLARAVLACADGVDETRYWAPREQWADDHARESLRRHLRFKLLDGLTSSGHVPTALPTEEIRHATMRYGSGPEGYTEVPFEQVDYDVVIVTLWVPVRIPPVDGVVHP